MIFFLKFHMKTVCKAAILSGSAHSWVKNIPGQDGVHQHTNTVVWKRLGPRPDHCQTFVPDLGQKRDYVP